MASQTIAKILSAEQAAAEIYARAESEANARVEEAKRQAQLLIESEAAKTAAAAQDIARETREAAARVNAEAEQSAREAAQALKQDALGKADAAQSLVISMIIPE